MSVSTLREVLCLCTYFCPVKFTSAGGVQVCLTIFAAFEEVCPQTDVKINKIWQKISNENTFDCTVRYFSSCLIGQTN